MKVKPYVKGKKDYEEIGPLTTEHVRYLNTKLNDELKKQTLSNWYGKNGMRYAWNIYLRRRGGLAAARE